LRYFDVPAHFMSITASRLPPNDSNKSVLPCSRPSAVSASNSFSGDPLDLRGLQVRVQSQQRCPEPQPKAFQLGSLARHAQHGALFVDDGIEVLIEPARDLLRRPLQTARVPVQALDGTVRQLAQQAEVVRHVQQRRRLQACRRNATATGTG
jgi:hypothetical protein